MPSYGVQKTFAIDTVYHVYNRGVAKNDIFCDEEDHNRFLEILTYYLRFPKGQTLKTSIAPGRWSPLPLKEMPVRIQAFCLMPNHFHFQISLHKRPGLTNFMRRLGVTYSHYFNEKYERVGHLFQGRYKALPVQSEGYFVYLPWYIHRNPLELGVPVTELQSYPYSSYRWYANEAERPPWLDTESVLANYKQLSKEGVGLKKKSFSSLAEFTEGYDESVDILGYLGIDNPRPKKRRSINV